jgi:VWFA-related protein
MDMRALRPSRILVVLLCVATCASTFVATQQAPVFRSAADIVSIDVTVLAAHGLPVLSLGREDFVVRIDGKPRTIVTHQLVQATPGGAGGRAAGVETPTVAQAAGRLFVFAIDRDTIPAGEGAQMLDAAARFIDGLPPGDRVAAFPIPATTSRVDLSTDRTAATRVLRASFGTYRPPVVPDGTVDPIATDWRQRAHATLRDLEALVDALKGIDDAKHLVFITGGPVATADDDLLLQGIARRAAEARVVIHAVQVNLPAYQSRAERLSPSAPFQKLLDRVPETPDTLDQVQSAAYVLAAATGGAALTPLAPDTAFRDLARGLSATYILGVNVESEDRNGKPHRIEVQVPKLERGGLVRFRRQFVLPPAPPSPPAPARPAPGAPDAPSSQAGVPTAAVPQTPQSALSTDVSELKTRLAAYVVRFEQEFAAVVAEERSVQLVHAWRGFPKGPESELELAWRDASTQSSKRDAATVARRQLLSDILMVQLPGRQWITYRDVAEVDGSAVRDRADRVRDLFLSGSSDAAAQFRRIAAESARYNLGDVKRTLNLPTVTLSFLRQAHQGRFQFSRGGDEVVDGHTCRVLRFKERTKPTLVTTTGGLDIPIEGRIWMDVGDGRVWRTELRFDRGGELVEWRPQTNRLTGRTDYVADSVQSGELRAMVRVDFSIDERAGVLVPSRMWEWYEGGNLLGRTVGDKTVLESLSTYSNICRFHVTTRQDVKH